MTLRKSLADWRYLALTVPLLLALTPAAVAGQTRPPLEVLADSFDINASTLHESNQDSIEILEERRTDGRRVIPVVYPTANGKRCRAVGLLILVRGLQVLASRGESGDDVTVEVQCLAQETAVLMDFEESIEVVDRSLEDGTVLYRKRIERGSGDRVR